MQVSVRELEVGQIDARELQGLALHLVDGHDEGGAHREVAAVQLERQRAVRGLHEDAGDEDPAARVPAGADLAVQDIAVHDFGEHARAIGQAASRVPPPGCAGR